jgi:hypothetical protein
VTRRPAVTVLMAVYNGEQFLEPLMHGVLAQSLVECGATLTPGFARATARTVLRRA